ncbi:hypothetical protein CORC01_10819 [Colletotrichum orchidophilum]|uniref:Uncharacterized protein n=1 Tax=Colletotrichum orchidophilum TaxID=1209926 RepID=A0A1G4AXN0_9PEZI|nr:uncharacterized protein CORC01_10819 [Colletotrichum orchidophilum]OHE93920.1 hypothetical protein CORC01_10819 [Colletotrichum orchidophilum]
MSDVEQAVVRLRDVVIRFASVMNETNAVSTGESMSAGHPSESESSKGVEGQAVDEPDLPEQKMILVYSWLQSGGVEKAQTLFDKTRVKRGNSAKLVQRQQTVAARAK